MMLETLFHFMRERESKKVFLSLSLFAIFSLRGNELIFLQMCKDAPYVYQEMRGYGGLSRLL